MLTLHAQRTAKVIHSGNAADLNNTAGATSDFDNIST